MHSNFFSSKTNFSTRKNVVFLVACLPESHLPVLQNIMFFIYAPSSFSLSIFFRYKQFCIHSLPHETRHCNCKQYTSIIHNTSANRNKQDRNFIAVLTHCSWKRGIGGVGVVWHMNTTPTPRLVIVHSISDPRLWTTLKIFVQFRKKNQLQALTINNFLMEFSELYRSQ